jgi:hypothetical protein
MFLSRLALVVATASSALLSQSVAPEVMLQARQLSRSWTVRNHQSYSSLGRDAQRDFLVGTARNHAYRPNRDAALALLSEWPYTEGLARAVHQDAEAALAAYRLGLRLPGDDPTGILPWDGKPGRPWAEGFGLHLEATTWRLQVIPAAAFLETAPQGPGLPVALHRAPAPTVLLHFAQLRPGLDRLAQVAGGPAGNLLKTAGAGSRAGFLITHVQAWLDKAQGAVGPLELREAWVLHYGRRGEGAGTLLFLPGNLPARTELTLGLLRLNPFSFTARARKVPLKDGTQVDSLRASGGQLYLETRPEGTWISDRLQLLEECHLPGGRALLGERTGWGRLAAAGSAQAPVSLWMLPKAGADADFECGLIRLAAHPRPLPQAPASLAKGAPRGSGLSVALGQGATRVALEALLHPDSAFDPPTPSFPAFTDGGSQLSPQQRRDYEVALASAKRRQESKRAYRLQLDKLMGLLEGQGAAFHWNGWTPAPALGERDRAALVAYRQHGYWMEGAVKRTDTPGYGGYGEPGFTPSVGLVLPLKKGKGAEAEALLKNLFALSFTGPVQAKPLGPVTLRRARVEQAFAPSYAVLGDALVVASDDRAATASLAGLQGQAPTLADLPASAWGLAELDGGRVATELEQLLMAYLGTLSSQPRRWWDPPTPGSADEVAEEVASTFGPFLDLIRAQGRVTLDLRWTPGGLEARPR